MLIPSKVTEDADRRSVSVGGTRFDAQPMWGAFTNISWRLESLVVAAFGGVNDWPSGVRRSAGRWEVKGLLQLQEWQLLASSTQRELMTLRPRFQDICSHGSDAWSPNTSVFIRQSHLMVQTTGRRQICSQRQTPEVLSLWGIFTLNGSEQLFYDASSLEEGYICQKFGTSW